MCVVYLAEGVAYGPFYTNIDSIILEHVAQSILKVRYLLQNVFFFKTSFH